MQNSIPWLNQNYSFDRSKALLKTLNMGSSGDRYKDYQNSRKWGVVNKQVGEKASACLLTSFISGLGLDYLNFLTDSSSKVASAAKKLLTAVSSSFEGERDNLMYQFLYGMGIDKTLTEDEIRDQSQAARSGKITAPDDWMENKLQELEYGEKFVAKSGELATRAARVKPVANVISSLLPSEFKKLVDTVLDLPAKCYWRLRFFGGSLHANFVTTAYNLVKDGIGSLFFDSSREKFTELKKELHQRSKEYFENKDAKEIATTSDASSLKLYFRMLTDRIAEHWNGIRNPEKVIKAKLEKGVINADDHISANRQRLSSITDLTGPFCAAFGLIGTVVFDPLSKIFGIAGIQTGKNLVNTLSSSRKFFQLANYIPRFIIPEIIAGKSADKYQTAVTGEGAKDENREVERQLYYAHKARGRNGIFGLLVATLNMGESFGHLFGVSSSENKLVKFMFDIFTRIGDTGFLMFFTERRRHMGHEAFSLSLIRERDHRAGKKNNSEADPAGINYNLEEISNIAKETIETTGVKINSIHDVIVDPVRNLTDKLSDREVFSPKIALA